jgi:spore coat protein A, manganese oxidase
MTHAGEGHGRGRLSRRDALRLGVVGAGAVVLGRGVLGGSPAVGKDEGDVDAPRIARFQQRLRIPPRLLPDVSTATMEHFTVTQLPALQQILPPPFPPSLIWGYNGITPGPTIVQRRATRDGMGPRSELLVRNRLTNPTSTHLHGSPSTPGNDGYPLDLVQPGQDRLYSYPNDEDCRTLWYHDHALHITGENVYRGLAGQFWQLPNDEDTREFHLDDLPGGSRVEGYGVHDIPLVLQDKVFDTRGRLLFDREEDRELLGNVTLVNGVPWPRMDVEPRRYRFRLVLGSNSRPYTLTLDKGTFVIIGTDAALLRAPVEVSRFRVGMAERYEFVLDFRSYRPGDTVTMRNALADGAMRDVMRFHVVPLAAGSEPDTKETPDVLYDIPRIPVTESVRTRRWRFERSGGEFVINGKPWEDDRVDARPRRNTTEIWEFQNSSGGWAHPVHVHLVDFQILSRNGRPPFPYEDGLKDTAYVGEGETVRVIMRFKAARDEAGNEVLGRYVMHCHNLAHEDHDMMNQWALDGGSTAASAGHAGHAAGSPSTHGLMLQWDLA